MEVAYDMNCHVVLVFRDQPPYLTVLHPFILPLVTQDVMQCCLLPGAHCSILCCPPQHTILLVRGPLQPLAYVAAVVRAAAAALPHLGTLLLARSASAHVHNVHAQHITELVTGEAALNDLGIYGDNLAGIGVADIAAHYVFSEIAGKQCETHLIGLYWLHCICEGLASVGSVQC